MDTRTSLPKDFPVSRYPLKEGEEMTRMKWINHWLKEKIPKEC